MWHSNQTPDSLLVFVVIIAIVLILFGGFQFSRRWRGPSPPTDEGNPNMPPAYFDPDAGPPIYPPNVRLPPTNDPAEIERRRAKYGWWPWRSWR